jgi:hypothetical protein
MGPGGARVRCPACAGSFVVAPEAVETIAPEERREAPGKSTSARPPTGAPLASEALAVSLLARLEELLGPRFSAARRDGRVLSDLGPELLAAWDAFREQVSAAEGAGVFRAVLRERWSVDLDPRR